MKPIYAILTAVLCLLSLRVDAQDNDPDNDVCSQFVGSMSLGSNSGNIISNGDVDYYQIDLQGPGVLHVTVNALLGAAFNVAVYPGTCGSTALASAPTGSLNLPNSVDALVCAGLYYVRIARQTGVAPLAYSFDAELNQDDQYECNNQLSEASPLLLNTTLQAQLYGINNTLLPVTTAQSSAADNCDRDFYSVQSTGCGVLRVAISNPPPTMRMNITVLDSTGAVVRDRQTAPNNGDPIDSEVLLFAGKYYILISEANQFVNYGSPILSQLPYTLTLSYDDTDQFECNNQLSEASPLLLNTTLQAQLYGINNTLLPVTTAQSSAADNCDRDFYSVQSTGCGVLRVAISNPPPTMRMNITVLDSTGAVVRDRQTAPNNGDPIDSEVLLFAGKYYILISEANQFVNYGSPILSQLPYTLTLSYDDTDQFECNNQLSEASPLLLNTTLQAQLYGINNTLPPVITAQGSAADNCDRDFYSVESPDCGVLRVAISNPPATLQMNITVLDSTGAVITDRVTALTDGAPVEVEALLYPGKSYILISEAGQFVNYGSPELSALPYTLTLEYDPTDQCECNNSASTACVIVADTVFNAKLRGVNVQYNPDQDVDFYEFSVGCDTLSIAVDSVPNTQRIKLTLFNGDGVTQNGTAPVSTIAGQTVNMQRIGLPPGTYYLRVSENANSMSSESYRLSIACGQLSTGTAVSDIGTSKPQFFPNPTSGALDVLLPASHTEGTLLQMDPAGRITHQQRFAAGAGRIALDLTDDQPGLYLLELRFADGTRAVERVMRQ